MESERTFRVYFYNNSEFASNGWVFSCMHEYTGYSFKELYKYLLHVCKDYFDYNLRDIYVLENCEPLIAFHISNGRIFVENMKTRRCMFYDNRIVLQILSIAHFTFGNSFLLYY